MFEKEGSDEKLNFDIKSVNHAVGLVVLFSVCTFIVFNVIYNVQETPYLDEVFHIPQAIRYCNGSFDEWDPKITTLPGLYIFSAGLLKPYGWVINRYLCTVYRLRGINLLCSIANLILFIGIRHKAVGSEGKFTFQVLWAPLNLALFPVLYFFTFLYYTDQISTLMVMIMYRLYLARKFNWSAFIGILSVMCRQTNIIWVAFCALEVGLETLETHLLKLKKQRDSRNFLENLRFFFSSLLREPKKRTALVKDLIWKEAGYILTGMAFLAFLWVNKGIVVGDRSAHQAVVNLPQLFYFSMCMLFFCFPYAVLLVKKFLKFTLRNPFLIFSFAMIFMGIVAFNTHVHPYLLADNRHYTFYLWRYYNKHWTIPYVLVPLHIFGFFCLYSFLQHQKHSFQIAFYTCFILSLVFQKLLEFRYFILPFLLVRLNMKVEARWQLVLEFIIFLCCNAFTIHLFLTRTFYWDDSSEAQRFMW